MSQQFQDTNVLLSSSCDLTFTKHSHTFKKFRLTRCPFHNSYWSYQIFYEENNLILDLQIKLSTPMYCQEVQSQLTQLSSYFQSSIFLSATCSVYILHNLYLYSCGFYSSNNNIIFRNITCFICFFIGNKFNRTSATQRRKGGTKQ